MKNKRKHTDQTDKAEEIARKKLAKLSKVTKPESPAVLEVKDKVNDVLESRKNSNNIIDIIGLLSADDTAVVTAAINGVKRIFCTALEKQNVAAKASTEDGNTSAEEKYKSWMFSQLQDTVKQLCSLFYHKKTLITGQALSVVLALIRTSWESTGSKPHWGQIEKQLLNCVLLSVCSTKKDSQQQINRLQELFAFDDVKDVSLKLLKKIISTATSGGKVNNFFVDNVISVLEAIDMNSLSTDNVSSFICKDVTTGESTYKVDIKEAKQQFSVCWLTILKGKINLTQYKRVLIMLQDKVIPHLPQPLLLTDFLLTSYSVGGAISLLALSSVFKLISEHNLEYPQFYTKLYQLFTPELLHVKYRARFFHLADIFLTSTHLPEYLAAAFVKRLARLCLTAPSTTIPMAVRFIHNLLHRHRGLVKMIDSSNTEQDSIEDDPFDNTADDPAESKAIESSLWEIETLQRHALPQVSTAAKDLIEKGVRDQEMDTSALLETDWSDLMDTETKKKIFPNVPINWEQPNGLKMANGDILSEIFAFA